jgi:hypothetical protein
VDSLKALDPERPIREADVRCGSRIVREVLLVANRSGYQWRGIWDSFDGVWGDIIIKPSRRHDDAIQP